MSLEGSGPCLSLIQAAVEPLGEARGDFRIAHDLARRIEARGLTEARRFIPWETKREFNEFLLGDCGVTVEQMREKGYANFPFTYGDFEKAGFKTKTGKVELYSERLAELGLDPLPDYTPTRVERETAGGARRLPVDTAHRGAGSAPTTTPGSATRAGRARSRRTRGCNCTRKPPRGTGSPRTTGYGWRPRADRAAAV